MLYLRVTLSRSPSAFQLVEQTVLNRRIPPLAGPPVSYPWRYPGSWTSSLCTTNRPPVHTAEPHGRTTDIPFSCQSREDPGCPRERRAAKLRPGGNVGQILLHQCAGHHRAGMREALHSGRQNSRKRNHTTTVFRPIERGRWHHGAETTPARTGHTPSRLSPSYRGLHAGSSDSTRGSRGIE